MKADNFDFIRVAAAFGVLISHTPPLHNNTFPLGWLGGVCVFTFFALSGYLVSGSWERDPHLGRFVARRILRVFPGLAAVILVAALIIGPFLTTLSIDDYLESAKLKNYLRSMFLFPAYTAFLPGVFETNPYKNTVNGSLWTLPMEVFMYAILGLMGALGFLHKRIAPLILLLAIAGCIKIAMQHPVKLFLTMDLHELSSCAAAFFGGMLMWNSRNKIPKFSLAWIPLTIAGYMAFGTRFFTPIILIGIPYAAISLGHASTPYLRRFGRYGDFSYGIYIYAFLIQQTIIAIWPSINIIPYFFTVSALTLVAAFFSWHVVEKPANSLKRFLVMEPHTVIAQTKPGS